MHGPGKFFVQSLEEIEKHEFSFIPFNGINFLDGLQRE